MAETQTIIGKTFALDRHIRGMGLVEVRSVDSERVVTCWDAEQQCEYPVLRRDLQPPTAMKPKEPRRSSGPYKSRH